MASHHHGATWRRHTARAGALVLLVALCAPAHADDQKTDKSQYSLLSPTPEADLRDFNPDRPAKITGPFTVDAGHIQIESDLANYTRFDSMGKSIGAIEALDPTIKLGVLNNVDVEMILNGLEDVTVHSNGRTRQLVGFGDVYFRTKINLIGDDGGDVAFAVAPYVKLPSQTPAALAIGDGVVEGGGLALFQLKLPQDFTLQLQSEVDALEGNGNSSTRYANFVQIANLSHAVPGIKDLTAQAEIYSSVSADPHTPDVYTADFALAYLIKPTTQLDVGVNCGLNRAAPGLQVYTGIAQRF